LASPISLIIHDCSGAAVAWLAMAQSQSRTTKHWEIRDTVLSDGRIATASTSSTGPQLLLLSDYIRLAVRTIESTLDLSARLGYRDASLDHARRLSSGTR
jgi:hypothetical protein